MKKYKIAAIPGDGIGIEVIEAGVEVLNALANHSNKFSFEFDHSSNVPKGLARRLARCRNEV